jgi:hypothetical protein
MSESPVDIPIISVVSVDHKAGKSAFIINLIDEINNKNKDMSVLVVEIDSSKLTNEMNKVRVSYFNKLRKYIGIRDTTPSVDEFSSLAKVLNAEKFDINQHSAVQFIITKAGANRHNNSMIYNSSRESYEWFMAKSASETRSRLHLLARENNCTCVIVKCSVGVGNKFNINDVVDAHIVVRNTYALTVNFQNMDFGSLEARKIAEYNFFAVFFWSHIQLLTKPIIGYVLTRIRKPITDKIISACLRDGDEEPVLKRIFDIPACDFAYSETFNPFTDMALICKDKFINYEGMLKGMEYILGKVIPMIDAYKKNPILPRPTSNCHPRNVSHLSNTSSSSSSSSSFSFSPPKPVIISNMNLMPHVFVSNSNPSIPPASIVYVRHVPEPPPNRTITTSSTLLPTPNPVITAANTTSSSTPISTPVAAATIPCNGRCFEEGIEKYYKDNTQLCFGEVERTKILNAVNEYFKNEHRKNTLNSKGSTITITPWMLASITEEIYSDDEWAISPESLINIVRHVHSVRKSYMGNYPYYSFYVIFAIFLNRDACDYTGSIYLIRKNRIGNFTQCAKCCLNNKLAGVAQKSYDSRNTLLSKYRGSSFGTNRILVDTFAAWIMYMGIRHHGFMKQGTSDDYFFKPSDTDEITVEELIVDLTCFINTFLKSGQFRTSDSTTMNKYYNHVHTRILPEFFVWTKITYEQLIRGFSLPNLFSSLICRLIQLLSNTAEFVSFASDPDPPSEPQKRYISYFRIRDLSPVAAPSTTSTALISHRTSSTSITTSTSTTSSTTTTVAPQKRPHFIDMTDTDISAPKVPRSN